MYTQISAIIRRLPVGISMRALEASLRRNSSIQRSLRFNAWSRLYLCITISDFWEILRNSDYWWHTVSNDITTLRIRKPHLIIICIVFSVCMTYRCMKWAHYANYLHLMILNSYDITCKWRQSRSRCMRSWKLTLPSTLDFVCLWTIQAKRESKRIAGTIYRFPLKRIFVDSQRCSRILANFPGKSKHFLSFSRNKCLFDTVITLQTKRELNLWRLCRHPRME